ncbi:glutathione S-transferase family protein [Nitratireductor sp. ZSWI3]|uniref:glutathione S-transferase family protein n=1 Tax=Nitratireductor sp. ZSWI3 TaxID=2966359 RepID=UPI002150225A|nr:glutathione S-transferase family protein [Nitratireductor sp. ZSWI3]MCR4265170.1 glutathione S-transferase family protein [Nitratireductor sp. ZSWI3]
MTGDLSAPWANSAVPIILRTTATSPFGRKVRMALRVLDMVERVREEPADTLDGADSLRHQNPLGKMPCLLIGGEAFYDSHTILEMLDTLAGGGVLVPPHGLARFRALTRAKLADGVTEAALLITYEDRFRAGQRSERWLDHQRGKIRRGLAALIHDLPDPKRADLVSITLTACLGYLDWRGQIDWRAEFPDLVPWLDAFAACQPAWKATERETV